MNILILQGHPDTSGPHFCHAVAEAYAEGATEAGHQVREIRIAETPVTPLRSKEEFESGDTPDYVDDAQSAIQWADHIVVVFPLWLGGMPAVVKAWFEQVFRYGFAMDVTDKGWVRKLKGKSARLVVTMGMPAMFYRWYFGQHGTKVLQRSVMGFSGVKPIRQSLIGRVDPMSEARAKKIFAEMAELGRQGL
ncbi:NAD(P)H-dependent oxidoreductase [Actibacterium pelagium]|uniref:Dehydrogenase n=1 Tax=Actibacterium pelagium TaxID=2029103 RepID=A0A917EIL1_9RHOB|nr:NAD(P)H-dependent oxidoreductase [Actibacterium pelagium]GGE47128.1 dehydrogenase [Actibacterium pelagium]